MANMLNLNSYSKEARDLNAVHMYFKGIMLSDCNGI